MSSESRLIADAKAGSVAAFTGLVEAYREGLFRFLLTRCNNHADAEDALQDTLINAYRYINSYNPQWRFSTWLYRIAIRKAMNNRDGNVVELGDVGSDERGPLDHAIAASNHNNLWSCARRSLNDEVYTAMWLRYVEDMSIKDIAAALDRSVSWTKVNLLRGRKVLDAELGQEGNEAYG